MVGLVPFIVLLVSSHTVFDCLFYALNQHSNMRVRLVFSLGNKGAIAPFHHQHILTDVLSDAYGEHLPANICFSCLKGQTKVTPLGLSYFSTKVSLVISSSDTAIIDRQLRGVFGKTVIEVGQLMLTPESVSKEEPPIYEEKARFVCISPLVVIPPALGDPDAKRFIAPETDSFSDLLYESTMYRMEQSGLYTPEQITSYFKFQVVPDAEYLLKMKREQKKFARIYALHEGEDSPELRGYTFPFVLYAHPEVQQFIFENGLGECCNQGFGMVDMAEQLFHNRMAPYYFAGRPEHATERTFLPRERVA